MTAPLAAGDQACVIIMTPPTKGGRRTVLDAALVTVEHVDQEHDVWTVRVLRAGMTPVGHRDRFPRAELFAKSSADELATFEGLVARFWGDSYRGELRPRDRACR